VAKPVSESAAQMPNAIAEMTTQLLVGLRQTFRHAIIGIIRLLFFD
jgi:hypothetical protein